MSRAFVEKGKQINLIRLNLLLLSILFIFLNRKIQVLLWNAVKSETYLVYMISKPSSGHTGKMSSK